MRRRLGIALALILVAAPAGWLVTDHLERDNDFCNACHLGPGRPLHLDVRRDFDARPAASLAAAHGLEPDFRCIDCHGGASWPGRARVKALAARDALLYVVGHFEEPEGMRWPLWDEDCAQCHARFAESAQEPERFHALPVHNADLGVACVECHAVHEDGANPAAHFIRAEPVRAQCARCHAEFE